LKLSPLNEAARKYLKELERNPVRTCEQLLLPGNAANIAETKSLYFQLSLN
jgi:hypothetical protein